MILMCDLQMPWHQLSLLLSTAYGGILQPASQPILVGWFMYLGLEWVCWYDSVGRFCLERERLFSPFSFCSLSVSVNLTWLFLLSLFLLLFFSHSLNPPLLPFPLSHFIQCNSELTAASDMLAAIFCPLLLILLFFPLFSLWSALRSLSVMFLFSPIDLFLGGTGWIWLPVTSVGHEIGKNESGSGSIW